MSDFTCPTCGKKFCSKWDLDHHRRTVRGPCSAAYKQAVQAQAQLSSRPRRRKRAFSLVDRDGGGGDAADGGVRSGGGDDGEQDAPPPAKAAGQPNATATDEGTETTFCRSCSCSNGNEPLLRCRGIGGRGRRCHSVYHGRRDP